MNGFILSKGNQKGTLNLNSREINFEILYNDIFERYYINLYEDSVLILGGRFLVNGCELLYPHLGLGKSLMYLGAFDLKDGMLVYEL